MTLHARLYTKPGCHLCEAALADLKSALRVKQFDIGEGNPEILVDGYEADLPG